jgi:hypothetical protein
MFHTGQMAFNVSTSVLKERLRDKKKLCNRNQFKISKQQKKQLKC